MRGIDKVHHPYVGLKVLGERRGDSSRCVPALLVVIGTQELVDEEAKTPGLFESETRA